MVFSVNEIFKNLKKILGHQAHDEFFVEKNHENPLTHYVIRANFVSNFGILKNCYRLWVTFDWSADEMFIKALF